MIFGKVKILFKDDPDSDFRFLCEHGARGFTKCWGSNNLTSFKLKSWRQMAYHVIQSNSGEAILNVRHQNYMSNIIVFCLLLKYVLNQWVYRCWHKLQLLRIRTYYETPCIPALNAFKFTRISIFWTFPAFDYFIGLIVY